MVSYYKFIKSFSTNKFFIISNPVVWSPLKTQERGLPDLGKSGYRFSGQRIYTERFGWSDFRIAHFLPDGCSNPSSCFACHPISERGMRLRLKLLQTRICSDTLKPSRTPNPLRGDHPTPVLSGRMWAWRVVFTQWPKTWQVQTSTRTLYCNMRIWNLPFQKPLLKFNE